MHPVFGLGNKDFMKIGPNFEPVFTSRKRGNPSKTFPGNLFGKDIWSRPKYYVLRGSGPWAFLGFLKTV